MPTSCFEHVVMATYQDHTLSKTFSMKTPKILRYIIQLSQIISPHLDKTIMLVSKNIIIFNMLVFKCLSKYSYIVHI